MQFSTCCFSSDYFFFDTIKPPFAGTNFKLNLGPEEPTLGGSVYGKRRWGAREVVVEADSVDVAQHALNLVRLSLGIIHNMHMFEPMTMTVTRRRKNGENVDSPMSTSHFQLAMFVAAKSSFRRARVRALAKYGLSLELCSVPPIELSPGHAPFHLPRSVHPEEHLRLAYSVVLAYAAIEELKLEVRASQKNPSFINGQWNRKVLNDLEERLRRAGIDLNEPVRVLQRGQLTSIDKKRAEKGQRTRWRPRGRVRDADMPVVDAINDLSFLRSRVSAHASGEIHKLSPYDAATAQRLVRRLFLESVGAWRILRSPTHRNAPRP